MAIGRSRIRPKRQEESRGEQCEPQTAQPRESDEIDRSGGRQGERDRAKQHQTVFNVLGDEKLPCLSVGLTSLEQGLFVRAVRGTDPRELGSRVGENDVSGAAQHAEDALGQRGEHALRKEGRHLAV